MENKIFLEEQALKYTLNMYMNSIAMEKVYFLEN
jgi:hypothetical protein